MGWAEQSARPDSISQYYLVYLGEAAETVESAIARLERCELSQRVSDPAWATATDTAHRIKGNAAMYNQAELGLAAERVEHAMRSETSGAETADRLNVLRGFAQHIRMTCADIRAADATKVATPDTSVARVASAPAVVEPVPARAVAPATATARSDLTIPANTPRRAPDLTLKRRRVVIAYSDPWVSELMASMFDPTIEAHSASDADELMKLVAQVVPDLVLMEDGFGRFVGDGDATGADDGTSKSDNLGLLRSLLSHPALPDVFVAFPPNSPERIAQALSLGVVGFSEDPLDVLSLAEFVNERLKDTAPSVLVVDDDPVVRDLLRRILGSAGMQVHTASDGLEALDKLSEITPDLVLLDRFMPRLEGGTVLYEIRNKVNLKSTPVLILTAMANQGEAKSWFDRGAADFIPKPFDPEEVLMRVRRHIGANSKVA